MTTPRCFAAISAIFLTATNAQAFFVDGDGHYALRGETQTQPGFQKNSGTYQAIDQSFRLKGEARVSDQSSLFLEFRLMDDPRNAHLGDSADPQNCRIAKGNPNREDAYPCTDSQDSGEPHYKPYVPNITKAYVRYAFDYCIIEAGRRGRDWGLGILLDSGTKPFSTAASVYDGVTCDINIQKTQTLGLSVGYDKLQETGAAIAGFDQAPTTRTYGANDSGDDLDQYFFTIQYDDRKANAGAAFTKQLGFYFAQISSRAISKGGTETDLKYLDLYTGFFLSNLSFRNEIVFRMGKSGDPSWRYLGGQYFLGTPSVNKVDSIGLAGELDWTIARSGAAIGPTDYNKGDATRHAWFFDYAYAPGDSKGDGYKITGITEGREQRDTKVTAMAFNRNYKPALLLFNQHSAQDSMNVDGQFDAARVENVTVFSTGYRYESIAIGNFEAKLVTASLANNTISDGEKTALAAQAKENAHIVEGVAPTTEQSRTLNARPAGFFGKSLGYELDLSYAYKFGREADLGGAIAAAMPGDAWRVQDDARPVNNFMIQTYASFHF